jgi:hypothetical protein
MPKAVTRYVYFTIEADSEEAYHYILEHAKIEFFKSKNAIVKAKNATTSAVHTLCSSVGRSSHPNLKNLFVQPVPIIIQDTHVMTETLTGDLIEKKYNEDDFKICFD